LDSCGYEHKGKLFLKMKKPTRGRGSGTLRPLISTSREVNSSNGNLAIKLSPLRGGDQQLVVKCPAKIQIDSKRRRLFGVN